MGEKHALDFEKIISDDEIGEALYPGNDAEREELGDHVTFMRSFRLAARPRSRADRGAPTKRPLGTNPRPVFGLAAMSRRWRC